MATATTIAVVLAGFGLEGAKVLTSSVEVPIPPGTPIEVRLDPLEASRIWPGDAIEVELSAPVTRGTRILIPQGSKAVLRLVALNELRTLYRLEAIEVDGQMLPIETHEAEIDQGLRNLRRAAETAEATQGGLHIRFTMKSALSVEVEG